MKNLHQPQLRGGPDLHDGPLQMAGNPDQQEDPVDDQYQEDLEDEVRKPSLLQEQKHVLVLLLEARLSPC